MVAITEEKKKILSTSLLAVVALLSICAYLWYMPPYMPVLPTTSLQIGNAMLEVELATTDAERSQGLSGRTSLPEGKGMFFVFDSPGNWGIWMKDMHFPIDIIWADQNGEVITVVENATPESYPKSFYPSVPAQYVLEVPAGFAKAHAIAEGSILVVK